MDRGLRVPLCGTDTVVPTLSSYGNGRELHFPTTGIISTLCTLLPQETTVVALTTASDIENIGNPRFEYRLRDRKQTKWIQQLLTHLPRECPQDFQKTRSMCPCFFFFPNPRSHLPERTVVLIALLPNCAPTYVFRLSSSNPCLSQAPPMPVFCLPSETSPLRPSCAHFVFYKLLFLD